MFFTIDIDGDAVDKKARPYTFAGTWDQQVNSNQTASPITNASGNAYSGSNTVGNKTQLFIQNYTASSGYYYTAAPTFTPTSVGSYANNYQAVIEESSWSAGKPTGYRVTVSFTTPEANVTGHNIDINSGTVAAFGAVANLISGATIDLSNLSKKAETRTLRVYGNSGCSGMISLRQTTDGQNYNTSTGVWSSSGSENYNAEFNIGADGVYEQDLEFLDNLVSSTKAYKIKVKGGMQAT